ncbi:MAG: phage tail sheath family protein, partial [Agathobaculum butyriciproducens]|nr:phage tail sheath family protein [Agathobaculum butyriciproducens]
MAYQHGVYTREQATSMSAATNSTAGLQVVFGTAPIYQLADLTGVTAPRLCSSYAEAAAALGYDTNFEAFTLNQSIKASFELFGVAPIVLVNVLDPNKAQHVTNVSKPTEQTVTGGSFVISAEQEPVPYVLRATLTVSAQTSGDPLVAGTDYTVEYDEDGLATVTLTSATAKALVKVYVTYKAIKLTAGKTTVTAAEITTAISDKLREVYPRFGMTPGLLLAPGYSKDPNVAAVMQGACENINGVYSCECILDVDCGTSGAQTYDAVKQVKESKGLTSPHAYAYWPMAQVGNYRLSLSAIMGARTAATDAANGDVPSLSPSNKSLPGVTGLCLEDGTEVILDQAQANVVNSAGIGTVLNLNGFKAWGNNTCAYPSTTDPKDRWIAVRRFFTWRSNSLIQTYFERVDSPANYRMIEAIVDAENVNGNAYVAAGACAAYQCEFRSDENPTTQILDGTI